MQTKKCSKCKVDKPFEFFNKSKSCTFGLHNHCRECQKLVKSEWYQKNRESEIKKSCDRAKSDKGIKTRKDNYEKNKEKILKRNRDRRRTPHARELANKARYKMYHENTSFRVSVNMRTRIRQALRDICKSDCTLNLIGCSIEELKQHLENQFTEGMTWDNYGAKGWHVDHIRPCDSFDLTNEDEQKQCFHFSNLQPLWWKDNISKGNKL